MLILERKLTLNKIYKKNKANLNKKLVSKTINNCYFGMYIYYKSNGYKFQAFFFHAKSHNRTT